MLLQAGNRFGRRPTRVECDKLDNLATLQSCHNVQLVIPLFQEGPFEVLNLLDWAKTTTTYMNMMLKLWDGPI